MSQSIDIPPRVIDRLYQDAGVDSYHPDGDQQEKLHAFASAVVAETIARLPNAEPKTAAGPFYVVANGNEPGFLSYGTGINVNRPEYHSSLRHAHNWPTFEAADEAANRAGLVCYTIIQPALGVPR
ncbi:hypothetical protein AWB80_08167 [Caballeronia pedi]|uniref:Uncharacterized protein n=1 Tax=Caballeronia pedi TaxID=1777141 RepID=A0A158E4G7_9BURK|nr:hypothetical protein [Caballeronia pedi]SAL01620.1 hypothetical protein AWB80_08167 [Caballeronia pedi]